MAPNAYIHAEERPFLAIAATLALAFHAGAFFFSNPTPSHPALQKVEETSTEVDLIPSIAEPFPQTPLQETIPPASTKANSTPTPQPATPSTEDEAPIQKVDTQAVSATTAPSLSVKEPVTVSVPSMLPPRQGTTQNKEASRSTKDTYNSKPSGRPTLHPVYKVPPNIRYPAESRAAGEQGTVLLRITVNADGKPIAVSIITSSGHNRLDRAAIEGGWRCRISNSSDGAQFEAPLRFSLRE